MEKEESRKPDKGFSELYIHYYARFTKLARRYVRDPEVAQDIVSDSFLSFWNSRDRLPSNVNAPAYLATTIRNRCLNHLESLQAHSRVEDGLHDERLRRVENDIRSLKAADPSAVFLSEVQRIIVRSIAALPARTRTVFQMSRSANKSYKEIASACNLTERQVAAEIQKALVHLRKALQDYLPQ